MSRVLVVLDELSTRHQVCTLLSADGHEVLQATDVEQAVAWATTEVVDLVVSDARRANLRSRVERGLTPHPVPFLFVVGAGENDPEMLADLAKGRNLFLLRQPLPLHLLSWLARSMIRDAKQLQGEFGDASLDQLLAHIIANRGSGVLSAICGDTVKKLVFVKGDLVFCSSNDPWEKVGQWCIHAGLIDEDELREALRLQFESLQPLLKVLQSLEKLTSAEAERILQRKFFEGALDLFLWGEGSWRYQRGRVEVEHRLRVGIDAQTLRREGTRRAVRWVQLRKLLPSDWISFVVLQEKFPNGFPATAGDRRLIELCRAGLNLGQIREELPGQDYGILSRFSGFLEMGVVEIPPRPPLMDPEAEAEFRDSKGTVTLDPAMRPAGRKTPTPAPRGRVFARRALVSGLSREHRVELRVPIETLMTEHLRSYEAFVLSRLAAGRMSVAQLIDDCPWGEDAILDILDRYVQDGTLGMEAPSS